MTLDSDKYQQYLQILKEELVPALGCTEPIAIAYASAKAREILGSFPEKIIVACSGSIIKNVKGVIVPNTGNLRGIKASAIIGALAGDAGKGLEVLSDVREEDIKKTKELIVSSLCVEEQLDSPASLHIAISVYQGKNSAEVEIMHTHTNIVKISKNGEIIYSVPTSPVDLNSPLTDRSILSVEGIYHFANNLTLADVSELLDKQIKYNLNIAETGLRKKYGANVGATLLKISGAKDACTLAKAYAAAGSDARMSGCVLPVIINSGSGNQGITASLPVIVYAQQLGVSKERLYRALVISNLISIHQKTMIGRLSAYCGAVSAACGSGAAITYLYDGSLEQICQTITNTLANVSGIVCDGAKPSCAAKIASTVDAAIMGHYMAMSGKTFNAGEGLIKNNIEDTIHSIGLLASRGMQETNKEILKIMIDQI